MRKLYHTAAPAELLEAVKRHAHALVAGDETAAALMLEERAAEAHHEAFERLGGLRPLGNFEVIARARIGFEYIVKLRLYGTGDRDATLQIRWHRDSDNAWRIVELNDL
ncbi:MAG TPA: hypothetical protein VJN94_16060, partial [Candidatus Binataceae bacterium]|nr:hypothetical protein [Candidatus Binataceae bacterium]